MKFNLHSCEINIHFSFFLLITLLLYFDCTSAIAAIVSAIIHEIGHLFAILLVKLPIERIDISAFNFRININFENIKCFNKKCFILAAGLLCNLLFCVSVYMLNIVKNKSNFILNLLLINNLLLFLLNILPIHNLDGGQILYCFLLKKLSLKIVNKVLNSTTIISIFIISVLGFYILIKSQYNYSLLILSFYLILLVFLKKNSVDCID